MSDGRPRRPVSSLCMAASTLRSTKPAGPVATENGERGGRRPKSSKDASRELLVPRCIWRPGPMLVSRPVLLRLGQKSPRWKPGNTPLPLPASASSSRAPNSSCRLSAPQGLMLPRWSVRLLLLRSLLLLPLSQWPPPARTSSCSLLSLLGPLLELLLRHPIAIRCLLPRLHCVPLSPCDQARSLH